MAYPIKELYQIFTGFPSTALFLTVSIPHTRALLVPILQSIPVETPSPLAVFMLISHYPIKALYWDANLRKMALTRDFSLLEIPKPRTCPAFSSRLTMIDILISNQWQRNIKSSTRSTAGAAMNMKR